MSEGDIFENFLKKFKSFHAEFLGFLENEESTDEKFQNLIRLLKETKIQDCEHELRLFLHMLVEISNNHYRRPNFFNKIEQILQFFKDDIKKHSNKEIFNIFKSNKRILLYLIEEKILIIDEYLAKKMTKKDFLNKKYPQYFAPEIKPFINPKWFPKEDTFDIDFKPNEFVEEIKKELPADFYELRKKGENNSYLCKLIREDSIQEFSAYLTRKNILPNAVIDQSIYETNPLLLEIPKVQMIEYAAFFGSIKIVNYLYNKVKLWDFFWFYAIHGKNVRLIHLLEDIDIEKIISFAKSCFDESVKCHYNDIANYFYNNYLVKNDYYDVNETIAQSLQYYNFSFLENEYINESSFYLLCKHDYYLFVKALLACRNIKINQKVMYTNKIQNHLFQ